MEDINNPGDYYSEVKNRCWNCKHAQLTNIPGIIKCEKIKSQWSYKNVCSNWEGFLNETNKRAS
jgi:hypothetical protein